MRIMNESQPKARKVHTCDWCGGDINVGEVYDRDTILGDGGFRVWKSHTECSKFASEYVLPGCDEDGASSDDFTYTVMEMAKEFGFDIELDEYELVNMISEHIEELKMEDV